MRPTLTCPYFAAQVPRDERHILGHCACWAAERGTSIPWLQVATEDLLAFNSVMLACMHHACLIPSSAMERANPVQVGVVGAYGMHARGASWSR